MQNSFFDPFCVFFRFFHQFYWDHWRIDWQLRLRERIGSRRRRREDSGLEMKHKRFFCTLPLTPFYFSLGSFVCLLLLLPPFSVLLMVVV